MILNVISCMPLSRRSAMVKLRRIGNVDLSHDTGEIVVELCKPLNADALDGISEWSHVWLLFLDTETTVQMKMFEIVRSENRKLFLKNSANYVIDNQMILIDIKPVHPLDLEST